MIEQIQIEYTNNKYLNNKENINKLVKKVLGEAFKKEVIPFNFFVLIAFITSEEIKEKNSEYRNIDKSTDILSFPVFEKDEIKSLIQFNKDKTLDLSINLKPYTNNIWSIGEIYINLEKIEEQAKEYNHSFERELAYILIHGFYHLLGYDHLTKLDQDIMREKEESILKSLNISRGNNNE